MNTIISINGQEYMHAYSDFAQVSKGGVGAGSVIGGKGKYAKLSKILHRSGLSASERLVENVVRESKEENYADFDTDYLKTLLDGYKHPEYLHPKVFAIAYDMVRKGTSDFASIFNSQEFIGRLEEKEIDILDVYRYVKLILILMRRRD